MDQARQVYIGTDGGATTSKTGAVWEDGATVSTTLLQRPTGSAEGPQAVVEGWVEGVTGFLEANGLEWRQVQGVGLAIPGPYLRYGVFDRSPNLPESFAGFDVYTAYSAALAARAGRAVPLVVGNDGNMGGVAEAHRARAAGEGTVVLLAPGSGLGCAFVDAKGLPLDGDTLDGMEAGHMPLPLHLLGAQPYPCGCGRTWGCAEVYTTISGLPYLLEERLSRFPDHPLAMEIFDFQARALGLHVAALAMAFDPRYVVIGGGLMDPEATTEEFRSRYLATVRETALPYLWTAQRPVLTVLPAALGDLSQAIGAALVALYRSRS